MEQLSERTCECARTSDSVNRVIFDHMITFEIAAFVKIKGHLLFDRNSPELVGKARDRLPKDYWMICRKSEREGEQWVQKKNRTKQMWGRIE